MRGRLSRGWAMARASFSVLRLHPKLALFPLISGAAWLVVLALIALSVLPQSGPLHGVTRLFVLAGSDDGGTASYVASAVLIAAAFAVLYVLTVVAVFFNVALIWCALRCLAGEEPSVRGGLAAAAARLPQILGWALVAATVGFLLEALEGVLRDKLGFLGALIGGLLEFGWSVVTYFVLPVLAVEGVGPIAAVRRSSGILREKWGESVAGSARFGLIGVLLILIGAGVFFVGLAIHLSGGTTATAGLAVLLMASAVAYALAVIIVLQALSTIFLSGVYVYATTGQVPSALDPDLVASAFRPKG